MEDMMQRYRNVFGTGEGKIVLHDLLTMCHFGVTLDPENVVQVAEYNVGLVVASKAGVLDGFEKQNKGVVP
jgi:hypothetical protein